MNDNLKVSGCIVTYNNADIIEACVESLLTETQGVNFTLYLSDNNSSDQTVALIKKRFPQVVVLENRENSGFGGGHNLVIPLLKSDYHFVINPDIVIAQDTITALCQYLETRPDAAMITPKVLNEDGTEQFLPKLNPSIRFLFLSKLKPFHRYRRLYTRQDENLSEPTEIDFCTGCFFGIRTAAFREAGGFDERYFMYLEDSDLSRTVRKKHKIIFYPLVSVYHKWHRENLSSAKGLKRWAASMLKYSIKWGVKF